MTSLQQLGVAIPIVQAPMAGVATPDLAAAVCEAGGLGSIGVGATDADGARAMIIATRARTERPFNVNLFVHAAAKADATREQQWLQALRPLFDQYSTEPPSALQTIISACPRLIGSRRLNRLDAL